MFMGKVVDIEAPARRKRGKGRKRPSKTALVLGGGGFTGGVYEIGALRALDLLAVNSTVNSFDVYVGTSAGSFVAGMLANGVTPDEMMQVLNERVPSELEDLDLIRPREIGHVHFQDVPDMPRELLDNTTRIIPGDGVAPLNAILHKLSEKQYAGPLSVELFLPKFQQGDPFQVATEIRQKAEGVMRRARVL